MRINVVMVQSGWILQKIAQRIVEASKSIDGVEFILSHAPRLDVHANFYCDIQNCFGGKTPVMDIGLFTHVHANELGSVAPHTFMLDYIFHMSERYLEMFAKWKKFPRERISIMVPWEIPSSWQLKKPTIGIFQRGKHEGKGFYRVMELIESPIAKKFSWLFVGNDWEDVLEHALNNNVRCEVYADKNVQYPDGYSALYDRIDYLLIPSKWEGGPICALEATAKGISIISADVGWVGEVLPKMFYSKLSIFKTDEELQSILTNIYSSLAFARGLVEDYSYLQCAQQIADVVNGNV